MRLWKWFSHLPRLLNHFIEHTTPNKWREGWVSRVDQSSTRFLLRSLSKLPLFPAARRTQADLGLCGTFGSVSEEKIIKGEEWGDNPTVVVSAVRAWRSLVATYAIWHNDATIQKRDDGQHAATMLLMARSSSGKVYTASWNDGAPGHSIWVWDPVSGTSFFWRDPDKAKIVRVHHRRWQVPFSQDARVVAKAAVQERG